MKIKYLTRMFFKAEQQQGTEDLLAFRSSYHLPIFIQLVDVFSNRRTYSCLNFYVLLTVHLDTSV